MTPPASPTNADELIERELDARNEALECAFDSDVLALVGTLLAGLDDLVRSLIEQLRRREMPRSRLAVLLHTNGGYIEPVQRIVDLFRYHYNHVSFIVPNYAFSAGTILAMSGDDIWMDYYSRLGPIDPQVSTQAGRLVPALGYLKKWEQLLEKANSEEGLSEAEVVLMIQGFDQAELYQHEQNRELSVALLREWLAKYKFKDWEVTETKKEIVTQALREQRAVEVARKLNDTDKWHIHGYGISMQVLHEDLKLRIDDLRDDPKKARAVKEYYDLLSDYMVRRGHSGVLHIQGTYQMFDEVARGETRAQRV